MRDYLVVAIILASLPVGLIRPFYGLLVYSWISYMYPHLYTWGFAQTFPVAKLSALSAIAGSIFRLAINFAPLRQRETVLMLLLWGVFTLSSAFAFFPDLAWAQWQDVSKLILMAVLASMLLNDRRRLRLFLLVVALSLGFYGFKGGLFSIATGGNYIIWGPGDSILGGNNNIGLALNMLLPLLWYLAQEEKGWLKRLLQAMFFLTMPAIIFTYSRASALTLPIILLPLIFKSRSRIALIILLLIGSLAALPFIPEKWWNRQNSVLTYERDESAMSRIDNWTFCWRLAMDRPLTGGGFEFQKREVFARYSPEFLVRYGGIVWDTHSIYFAMLATHGFPGLVLFLGMIIFSLLSCRRMQIQVRNRPDLSWVRSYCSLAQLSFLAFLVNGFFVNMEYFDLPYHLVAVVVSMKLICARAFAEAEVTESPVERNLVAATS